MNLHFVFHHRLCLHCYAVINSPILLFLQLTLLQTIDLFLIPYHSSLLAYLMILRVLGCHQVAGRLSGVPKRLMRCACVIIVENGRVHV